MNALRRLWASDSGQALVESALCLPVLILFLAAVIDLGLLIRHDTGEQRPRRRAIRLAERDERGGYSRHANGRDERRVDCQRDGFQLLQMRRRHRTTDVAGADDDRDRLDRLLGEPQRSARRAEVTGKPSTPLVPRLAIQIVFTVAIALAGFVPG
jgi:hypothetical protein